MLKGLPHTFFFILLLLAGLAGANDYHRLNLDQLRSLAEQGDAAAQVELGIALEHGEGVKKSPQMAREWYCRAAVQGAVDAQRNLGWMYANGSGVVRNDEVAAYWLGRAAAAGDDYSARLLTRIGKTEKAPLDTGCTQVASLPWLQERCKDPQCHRIVRLVERMSVHYDLDPNLVLSVISAESAFNPRALSPKGASGLMQLIPATARRFGVKDVWNPEQNLRGGMAYLQWLLAYFEGDLEWVLAGYNAGEHRVERYRGVPPFAETRAYVKRILRDYGKSYHPYQKRWLERSSPVGVSVVRVTPQRDAAEEG
jgi:hypothetical protein